MIGLYDCFVASGSIRIDRISRITPAGQNAHGTPMSAVHFDDDRKPVSLTRSEVDKLLARPAQLLPAEPGINLLGYEVEGDDVAVWRTPVIAWALCLDGEVRLVTPAGVDDSQTHARGPYVEMPGGMVMAVGEFVDPWKFDSVDDLLAFERDRIANLGKPS